MSKSKYLKKFQISTTIGLDELQKQDARHLINLFFIGRPKMKSLDEPITTKHSDAHWALNRQRSVVLEIGLMTDGNFEVIRVV